MSIPHTVRPLGLGGVTILDSVHVSGAATEPYSNLIVTAFGEDYYLEPFGSEGYFAEVAVDNVSGVNLDLRRTLVAVGNYAFEEIGSLIFYSWGSVRDNLPAVPNGYDACSVRPGKQYSSYLVPSRSRIINNFSLRHKVENGVYSGEAAGRTVTDSLGSWTAEQNVRMKIFISKIPGLSYDFKKLVARTENVKFEALPARKNGKDGIAIIINDRLKKFIEV